jgi:hypothetical protein
MVLASTLVLTLALGCGGKRTYQVVGRVTFKDGTPLTGGQVVFEPVDKEATVGARGQVQPDGTFRMGTYRDDDGVIEGRHKVLVVPPLPRILDERRPAPPIIHPRFQKFETSGLEYTVTRDNKDYAIVVDRP